MLDRAAGPARAAPDGAAALQRHCGLLRCASTSPQPYSIAPPDQRPAQLQRICSETSQLLTCILINPQPCSIAPPDLHEQHPTQQGVCEMNHSNPQNDNTLISVYLYPQPYSVAPPLHEQHLAHAALFNTRHRQY